MALFALDQNFPQPILAALAEFIPEAELVPLGDIDALMSEIEDWEVLLALYNHARSWDGLITMDKAMLNLPREMAVLRQTNLTLVVAEGANNDPIKATGLLMTHLSYISQETMANEPQIWRLSARNRPAGDPWERLVDIANHQNLDVQHLWFESRLTAAELARDPLA